MIDNFSVLPSVAVRSVERITPNLERSIEGLSSGSRVSPPRNDVASYAIGSRFATRVAAQNAINANLSTGLSMGQAADAVYARSIEIMTRMKVLAVQAGSGNLGDRERGALNIEFQKLIEEIDRQALDAEFNGVKLASTGLFPPVISNFGMGGLPANAVVGGAPGDVASVIGDTIQLVSGTSPANSDGTYVNNSELDLTTGLSVTVELTMGVPASVPGNAGGGVNLVFYDGDAVDWSTNANGLAPISDNTLGFITNAGAGSIQTGGYLSVALDSQGRYGDFPNNTRDRVTVIDGTGNNIRNGFDPGFPNGLDGTGSGAAGKTQKDFEITVSITGDKLLSVTVTDLTSAITSNVVTNQDISGVPAPDTLKFGIVATNGSGTQQVTVNSFAVGPADVTTLEERMAQAGLRFRSTADSISPTQNLLLPIFDATAPGLLLEDVNILTKNAADSAIAQLDESIDLAVEARSILAGAISAFESAIDRQAVKIEQVERARSGLQDLNVAAEISRYTALELQRVSAINMIRETQDLQRTFSTMFVAAERVAQGPSIG